MARTSQPTVRTRTGHARAGGTVLALVASLVASAGVARAAATIQGLWQVKGSDPPQQILIERLPDSRLYVRAAAAIKSAKGSEMPVFEIVVGNLAVTASDDGVESGVSSVADAFDPSKYVVKDDAVELFGSLEVDVTNSGARMNALGGPVWSRSPQGPAPSTRAGGVISSGRTLTFDPASNSTIKDIDNLGVTLWGEINEWDQAKNDAIGKKDYASGAMVELRGMKVGESRQAAFELANDGVGIRVPLTVTAKQRGSNPVGKLQDAFGLWPAGDYSWTRGSLTLQASEAYGSVVIYRTNTGEKLAVLEPIDDPTATVASLSGAASRVGGRYYRYDQELVVWQGVRAPIVIMDAARNAVVDFAPDPGRSSTWADGYAGSDRSTLTVSKDGQTIKLGGAPLTTAPTERPSIAGQAMIAMATAIREGNSADVQDAISNGIVGPDSTNAAGETLLQLAARADSPAILEAVLTAGGDLERRSPQGLTPLQIAMQAQKPENVKLLVQRGASLGAKDGAGNTPLIRAAQMTGPAGYEMLQALLSAPSIGNYAQVGNDKGEIPTAIVAKQGDVQKLRLFADAQVDLTSSLVVDGAVASRKQEVTDYLMTLGVSPALVAERAIAGNVAPILVSTVQGHASEITAPNALWDQAVDAGRDPMYPTLAGLGGLDVAAALKKAVLPKGRPDPGQQPVLGPPAAVRALLDVGADATEVVNFAVRASNMPLLTAALAKGAQADSAIVIASKRENLQMVNALLPAVATVPPDAIVASANRGTLPIMTSFLAKAGTDPSPGLPFALRNGNEAMTSLILGSPAVTDVSKPEWMALAVQSRSIPNVTKMLDKHANPDDGFRAAVETGQAPMLELLYARGASRSDAVDVAAARNDLAIVNMLLAHGGQAQSGMAAACEKGGPEVVETLIKNGASATDPAYLKVAVARGAAPVAHLLIANGADAKSPEFLLLAARVSSAPTLAELLAAGADPNTAPAGAPTTPLMVAVERGCAACVKVLLDGKADPNAQPAGKSPLHVAVNMTDATVVQHLLAAKADFEAKDVAGATPLFYAVHNKKVPAFTQLLVDAGADVNAIGPGGKIIWQNSEGGDVHKILKDHGARTKP